MFKELINRMLPNENDQKTLLSYMASCVQNPGKKFQWAMVLQGPEGNGKTLIANFLRHAVGFERTFLVCGTYVDSVFNSWISGKKLVVIEEFTASDTLKHYIVNNQVTVHRKGEDPVTEENQANFFLCTCDISTEEYDRRFCVLHTHYYPVYDFQKIYEWAENGGYGEVTEFLKSYNITPF